MKLRNATTEDAALLFEWRNDPSTRNVSKNSGLIQWEAHLSWLTYRLSKPKPNLFIAEVQGQDVGTLRIDRDEISYTVAPDHRGKGYGQEMLKLAYQRFGSLTANVKRSNLASAKIANRAGHIVRFID